MAENPTPSRFRPHYRDMTADEKNLLDAIKSKAIELEEIFERVNHGRYRALAMTSIEEAVMWAVKGVTA